MPCRALRLHSLILLATATCVFAQTVPPPQTPKKDEEPQSYFGGLLNRVQGLFDIDLPRLDPPGTFNLQFSPRFSDLRNRDYIRIPTGLRWTANEELELNVSADAYATHGLNNPDQHNYGIGQLRFGGRYLFREYPKAGYKTSVGLNTLFPVGSPPTDLTDGRNHYIPYFITEHQWRRNPRFSTFWGLSADLVQDSPVKGGIGINQPHDHSNSIDGGIVYDLGQIKYTLQLTYTTTELLGDTGENIFTVRPSVLWFVPKRWTFNSKIQWVLGFGVRGTWGPDGFEFSQGTRVRTEITFAQFMRKIRGQEK